MFLPTPSRHAHESHDDTYDTTPSGSTTITASATPHVKGSPTQIIAASSCDAELLILNIEAGPAQSATATGMLLDICFGAAGGQVAVANINVGSNTAAEQRYIELPLRIPRGTDVWAQAQAVIASDTVGVTAHAHPGNGSIIGGTGGTTYGAVTATSRGTPVTAANGSWGSWTSIGSPTARNHRLLVPSIGRTAAVFTPTAAYHYQIGVNSKAIARGQFGMSASEEVVWNHLPWVRRDIPTGSQLQARTWGVGAAEAADFCIHCFD